MNEHFKAGFAKTASPELVAQSHTGYGYMDPSDQEKKRQGILERYSDAENKKDSRPSADKDKMVSEDQGTEASKALGYQGRRG